VVWCRDQIQGWRQIDSKQFCSPTQMTDVKLSAHKKWVFKCQDGSGGVMEGVLASQLARALDSGTLRLKGGDVIRATNYLCNKVNENEFKLVISDLEVTAAGRDSGAARDQAAASFGGDVAMAIKEEPQQQHTPAPSRPAFGTPGPTPSPSEE
jgi:hypothetical protein